MNNNFKLGLGLLGIAVAVYLAYRLGRREGMSTIEQTAPLEQISAASAPTLAVDPSQWSISEGGEATRRHMEQGLKAGDIDPVTGREILHYYDPMLPANKFEDPGKSPFMDMMMVPAYAGASQESDAGTVQISPRLQQNTGIRSAAVRTGSIAAVIDAVGSVAWNERDQVQLQARAQGFVERLHVRAEFDPVTAGQALADLYVPDWIAAQEEYFAVSSFPGSDLDMLLASARSRMRQAGMSDEQIAFVIERGAVQRLFTLRSPIAGIVTELGVRDGMTIMPGMTLFGINGTASVWAEAEVPESQAALLRAGDRVTAETPSVPGKHYEGRVQALLPSLDRALRTRKARIELENPEEQLVPGMLMRMSLAAGTQESVLLIPTAAIVDTGPRKIVFVDEGQGSYRPTKITTGTEAGEETVVTSGLEAGERVVVSGQFLLDSEASLNGLELRLGPVEAGAAGAMP